LDVATVRPAYLPAALLAETAGELLLKGSAGGVVIDGENDLLESVETRGAIGQILELGIVGGRRARLDRGGCAVGHGDRVAEARLLERQLVALAFDDDRSLLIGDVGPVEDLLCVLHLRQRLGAERPEFDVHEFAVAEIRKGDAVDLGIEPRDVRTRRADAVAAGDGFRRCRDRRASLAPPRSVRMVPPLVGRVARADVVAVDRPGSSRARSRGHSIRSDDSPKPRYPDRS
jgi:hypothetical protein